MPMYELGLPVSASSPKITHNGVDYSLVLGTDTFTRVGKDGNEVVLPLCGGDEYVGESLEGQWKKGYTGAWKAANPFTAILESTNNLIELGGLSNTIDVWVYGWIDGHHPIVMMNELEVNVLLEVPTNTASGATQGFKFRFFITKDKIVSQPNSENDYIKIEMDVTDGGLLLNIFKHIGGAGEVPLFHGSDYDGDNGRAATGRVTIWRVVFHDGVAGADSPGDVRHMHVHLKQGATRAAADGATEHELIDAVLPAHASPYNISDLLFNVGYPAYEIGTEDDTDYYKQDNDDEAMSEYLKVSYPALFALKYDFVDASYGYGDVELWDAKGSAVEANWQQVFDEDHSFGTHDIVLQNGLVRLIVDRVQQYGLEFYYWNGAAWVQPFAQLFFHAVTSAKDLSYPVIKSIESISPEKTAIVVRLLDSDTVNDDYYIDVRITLERGKYTLKIDSLDVFPDQDVRFKFLDTTTVRFGYIGDDDIGDDDIAQDGINTTMTDNFLIALDDPGVAVLGVVFTDEKPAGGSVRFFAEDGGDLSIEDIDVVDTSGTIIWVSLIPFTDVANLFAEAEDDPAKTTITAAVRTYLDGAGLDTVTENDGVWVATLNCGVVENDGVDNSVGTFCTRITSTALGQLLATCTPAAPLAKLVKFDNLKLYLHRSGAAPAAVIIRLVDSDADYVWISQAIDGVATEYTIPLPHSDTDLQGWTEVGTFRYDDFTTLVIEWTDTLGGGEIVYVDGLHEYIGTTTLRGRGETLSGGGAVVLDAQDEDVTYVITSDTDLPEGRYFLFSRAKDTDQVAADFGMRAYKNQAPAEIRNEENAQVTELLASTFSYDGIVFDITAADVATTRTIQLRFIKVTATENTIFVDYFLLIPIGDGKDLPQDLAHANLRTFTKPRRLYVR